MPQASAAESASPRSPEAIRGYHAHIYYDPASRETASKLRDGVAAAFPQAVLGRWHDVPVGPHPQAMYQIAFENELLPTFLPWLMLNRAGLTILLHPQTNNSYADHAEHAAWFGAVLPLRLEVLRRLVAANSASTSQPTNR